MPTPNEFIVQLIQRAATKRESPYIVPTESWLSVDTSRGSVTIMLPRSGPFVDARTVFPNIRLVRNWTPPIAEVSGESYARMLPRESSRANANGNGDIFPEVRQGGIVNSLWGSEVIVSRLVPPPPVIPPATGPVERRYRISEEPGLAVANLAGVRRLEISTRERDERARLGRPEVIDQCPLCGGYHAEALACQADELRAERLARVRQQIMADEDRRIFAELDRLGLDGLQATVPMGRQWGMSNQAAGRYGWHNSPPEQPPPAERVRVPEFEIASNPTIPIAEIRSRRFNLVDREQPRFMEASWVSNPVDRNAVIQRKEMSFTNAPRPYCPTSWERLLGEDSV